MGIELPSHEISMATKKRGRTIEKVNFTNDLRRSISNLEKQLEDEEKYERFLLNL